MCADKINEKMNEKINEKNNEKRTEKFPEKTTESIQGNVLDLVLVRHGVTQWNTERRYLGHTDLPLLPDQAGLLLRLKEQLAASGGFQQVWCSDLLRCRETLAAVVSSPPLLESAVYDQRLREMNFGDWEGCTYEQLKDRALYRSWIDDPTAITPPNGESWEHFAGRVSSFLGSLRITKKADMGTDMGAVMDSSIELFMGLSTESLMDSRSQSSDSTVVQIQHESREQPAVQRVLIVTHGGVIRELLARTRSGASFREVAPPQPGTFLTLRLRWGNGKWSEAGDAGGCPRG